jgi:hypothetical protein
VLGCEPTTCASEKYQKAKVLTCSFFIISIFFFTTNIRPTGPPNLVQRSVLASCGFQPPLDRGCGESNRGPPYQVQRQSPLDQLTIGKTKLCLFGNLTVTTWLLLFVFKTKQKFDSRDSFHCWQLPGIFILYGPSFF